MGTPIFGNVPGPLSRPLRRASRLAEVGPNRREAHGSEGAISEPALYRVLRAGRNEGRDVNNAFGGLAEVFGRRATAARIGPHVTCAEADRIAWVLICSRHTDAATVWLNEHAASDSDDDLHGGNDFGAIAYITGRR